MSDLEFDTLVKKNNAIERWYPQPVSIYKNSIIVHGEYDTTNRIRSNFAYSMQYLEFLEKEFDELNLSDVLTTMQIKSYIVTGMGIIEMLLVNLLHYTGNWNVSEWGEYKKFISNPQNVDGKTHKIETHVLEKVLPFELRMDLDSMIKKTEKKNLISISHDVFPALKRLRELRNRVHLQIGESAYDHDYNIIQFEDIQMMRRILYSILSCNQFCSNLNAFEFIKKHMKSTVKLSLTWYTYQCFLTGQVKVK